MSICSITDEKLAVERIAYAEQKTIVIRKRQSRYFVIVLREAEDCALSLVIPNHDVAILAPLARGKHLAVVADGEAGDLVVVSSEEVLIVGVVQVANHDT